MRSTEQKELGTIRQAKLAPFLLHHGEDQAPLSMATGESRDEIPRTTLK
jgi:hypothetical protein